MNYNCFFAAVAVIKYISREQIIHMSNYIIIRRLATQPKLANAPKR